MTTTDHIRMAKVYLHAASCTQHRGWAFCLLNFAANQRRNAFALRIQKPAQGALF